MEFVRGDRRANGVIDANFDPDDSVAAGYPSDSYAFVSGPVWFTGLPDGTSVSVAIESGDFFLSGFWRDWPTSGAAGQPVVAHGPSAASQVTLIGIDPTFRAHPSHTYRILSNAIYQGLE